MKIQHFRCFAYIAEKGSMRAAAEELGLSATAVSLALRELERHTGAPLFTRQPQGVALTYAGRRLLAHARLIRVTFFLVDWRLLAALVTRSPIARRFETSVDTRENAAFLAVVCRNDKLD